MIPTMHRSSERGSLIVSCFALFVISGLIYEGVSFLYLEKSWNFAKKANFSIALFK